MKKQPGRNLLKDLSKAILSTGVLASFAAIILAGARGKYEPGKRINMAVIDNGRISMGYDMQQVQDHDDVQILAVCDVESKRENDAEANALLSRPQKEMYTVNY